MKYNDDQKLTIIQAIGGNPEAVNYLLEINAKYIYASAFAILKNKEDTEDAVQQSMIAVWQNIQSLGSVEAFDSWLYRIVYTRSLNILKASKSDELSFDDEIINDYLDNESESELMLPSEYAERNDLRERLFKIINSLSAVQRETVVLYYYNEKTVGEISAIMDCSEGTVKSRLHLARKYIKNEIENYEKKHNEKFFGFAVGAVSLGTLVVRNISENVIPQGDISTLVRTSGKAAVKSAEKKSIPTESKIGGIKSGAAKSASKHSFPLAAKIAVSVLGAVAVAGTGILIGKTIDDNFLNNSKNNTVISETSDEVISSMENTDSETTQPETTLPAEFDYSEAYKAYKSVIQKNVGKIKAYDWQFEDEGTEDRQIVFADIMGDSTPELIFVSSPSATDKYHDSGFKASYMNIYTYSNGDARCVYSGAENNDETKSNDFMGLIDANLNYLSYIFYQNGSEKNLYLSTNTRGAQSVETYIIYKFYEKDDGLVAEKIIDGCDFTKSDKMEGEDYDSGNTYYRINGKSVTSSEFVSYRKKLLSNMSDLLMYSEKNPFINGDYIKANHKAMTYGEAIKFLSNFDKSSKDDIDFSIIAGEYNLNRNGTVGSNIRIDADGSFRSEVSGHSADYSVSSVCTGRIDRLEKVNDKKYTFYVADTSLENKPGTQGSYHANGNKISIRYFDNEFNTGSKFTVYLKGANPSDMTKEEYEEYKYWFREDCDKPTERLIIFLSNARIYM